MELLGYVNMFVSAIAHTHIYVFVCVCIHVCIYIIPILIYLSIFLSTFKISSKEIKLLFGSSFMLLGATGHPNIKN